jgi:hypothetical protein
MDETKKKGGIFGPFLTLVSLAFVGTLAWTGYAGWIYLQSAAELKDIEEYCAPLGPDGPGDPLEGAYQDLSPEEAEVERQKFKDRIEIGQGTPEDLRLQESRQAHLDWLANCNKKRQRGAKRAKNFALFDLVTPAQYFGGATLLLVLTLLGRWIWKRRSN